MNIAIIIPTYKPGEYIWDCLDSLKEQDCSRDLFEVIIILNGEKQPYYDRLNDYLSLNSFKFTLLHTEEKGVSNARNLGLDIAQYKKTEYVLFLDDDDKLSENFISGCVEKATYNNIVISNTKTFFNNESSEFGVDYISKSFKKNLNKTFNIIRYRSFFSSACAKFIPLKIIHDFRFDKRFKIGEDSLFCFTFSKNITNCTLTSEDTIYYRRLREESASRVKKSRRVRMIISKKLIKTYTKVYLSDLINYNFFFYLSRVIAAIIKVFK